MSQGWCATSSPTPDRRAIGADSGNVRQRVLLALLVLTWGVSWPVIKVGVSVVPPIWFACLRYVIAAALAFIFVALRGELTIPPRSDWPLVAVSGILQMAAYSALTGLALTKLPPGRSSVLAFSTPIWVVPLAGWLLKERISKRAMFGVGVGLVGLATIAAPSLRRHGVDQIVAYALLMGAAAAWAVTIIFVRLHRFTTTPLALAPWQMLVAAVLLYTLAHAVEGAPPAIGARAAVSLAYVGPVATAFAYWAVVDAGRHLRASTMSVGLMATPGLGILISALTLGEPVGASLVAGLTLTGVGIRLATKVTE
jgi:O-acetylserine/cysteine efflux transporter